MKNDMLNAATQFKSGMNFELEYKLNRVKTPIKKSHSVARIK